MISSPTEYTKAQQELTSLRERLEQLQRDHPIWH